jgi:hypothetical protein
MIAKMQLDNFNVTLLQQEIKQRHDINVTSRQIEDALMLDPRSRIVAPITAAGAAWKIFLLFIRCVASSRVSCAFQLGE